MELSQLRGKGIHKYDSGLEGYQIQAPDKLNESISMLKHALETTQ
jgi:hypothetical protein